MSLQTPVRQPPFNQPQPLIPNNRLLAALIVVGWLLWFPQRLAQFEAVVLPQQGVPALPRPFTGRAWRTWYATQGQQGNPVLTYAVSLAVSTAIVSILCWLVTLVVVQSIDSSGRFALLLMSIFVVTTLGELIFICALPILADPQASLRAPIGSALIIAHLFVILFAATLIGFGTIRAPQADTFFLSPVMYSMLFAWLLGMWLSTAFAFWRVIDNGRFVLAVESGLAGVAIGGLTASGFLGLSRSSPSLTTTEILGCLTFSMLAASIAFAIGVLRLDQWSFTTIAAFRTQANPNRQPIIPWNSPLPSRQLSSVLDDWLDTDFWAGMQNAWLIWDSTRQQVTVSQAVQRRLSREQDAEAAVRAVNLMIEQRMTGQGNMRTADWAMLFSGIPDRPNLRNSVLPNRNQVWGITATAPAARRRQRTRIERWATNGRIRYPPNLLPTAPPYQAVAAVFWYLQFGFVGEAVRILRGLPRGGQALQELRQIATALEILWNVEGITATARLTLPAAPPRPLWPGTWIAIDRYSEVAQLAWIFRRTNDAGQRAWCQDRAREILLGVQGMADVFNTPARRGAAFLGERTGVIEARFIQTLAAEWIDSLEAWANTPPIPALRQPTPSPFLISQPIPSSQANTLIGREQELAQLVATWTVGSLASTLLFGPPLIGKTSLINAAVQTTRGRANVIFVSVDRGSQVLPPATVLLFTICQRVCADAKVPVPRIEDPFWLMDPFPQFNRFFSEAVRQLGETPIVIVVDSVDALENAAIVPGVLSECIEHLLLRTRLPQVAFTFVTRLPPEYWRQTPNHPLLRLCSRRELGGLDTRSFTQSPQARRIELVRQIVNLPLRNANLRFQDDALEHMFNLANGCPYLIKALADAVIADYNDRIQVDIPSFLLVTSDINRARRNAVYADHMSHYGESIISALEQNFSQGRRGFVVRVLLEILQMPLPIRRVQLDTRFPATVFGNPGPNDLDLLLDCMRQFNIITPLQPPRDRLRRRTRIFWDWLRTR